MARIFFLKHNDHVVCVGNLVVLIQLVWVLGQLRKLLDVVISDDTVTTSSDETNWLRGLLDGLKRFTLLFYPYQGRFHCEEA